MKLKNIINPLLRLKLAPNRHLLLTEAQNIGKDDKLAEVAITELPESIFAYSTDSEITEKHNEKRNEKRKLYNEYLNVQVRSLTKQDGDQAVWINEQNCNPAPYLDKRADAVIIHQDDGDETNFNILICELKSRDLKRTDCEEKFMVEKVFIEYAINLLRIVFKEKIGKVEIKFAIFYLYIPEKLPSKGGFSKKATPKVKEPLEVETMPNFTDYTFIRVPCADSEYNHFSWNDIINCS